MSITRELIVYGAGGNGIEIASMAVSGCNSGPSSLPWRVTAFIDDTPGYRGRTFHGVPCLGNYEEAKEQLAGKPIWCHAAIGDNEARSQIAKRILDAGWNPATVVHLSALISQEVDLGTGSFVGYGVTISPKVKIGRHALINTYASIAHHVTIGDFGQLSLRSSLLGHSRIERGATVGAHAVVMSGVTIGAWATVGIGTPVLKDVKPGHTVILPLAKTIFERNSLPD